MGDPLDARDVVIAVLSGAVFGTIGWLAHAVRAWSTRRRAVKKALDGARATIRGQVAEQLAPLTPAFGYSSSDARFLGAPVDYVVFDGYSKGDDVDVVIVEVKSGKARLSDGEKRIRDAVEAGRVRFETLRIDG